LAFYQYDKAPSSHELFDKVISLVEKALNKLKSNTKGFELDENQTLWLCLIRDLLLTVGGQLMVNVTSINSMVIAFKCLPSLLNILQNIKDIFTVVDAEGNMKISLFERANTQF
jgi:hypothetical protein